MSFDFQYIVIGGGSAGYNMALKASAFGASVCLIESKKLGGDSVNVGCIPSKTFLKAAFAARDVRNASTFGVQCANLSVDFKKVVSYVAAVTDQIQNRYETNLEKLKNVTFIQGEASFVSAHEVMVNGNVYSAEFCVVATGSRPFMPPIPGLSDVSCHTSDTIFKLDFLPKHLIVLGGGAIGLEFGQGFAECGAKVTVVDRSERLFSYEEPEVHDVVYPLLKNSGMDFYLGCDIKSVSERDGVKVVTVTRGDETITLEGDTLLVSLGRCPNTESLNLESVGVNLTARGCLDVNECLYSSVPSIIACGDVAGPYQFTHTARYQADVILKNTLLNEEMKVDYSAISWATYVTPEIAHSGLTEEQSKKLDVFGGSQLLGITENDRSVAIDDQDGFIKLIFDKENCLIGATIVSRIAGELIGIATVAIQAKFTSAQLSETMFAYPTQSTLFRRCSLEFDHKQVQLPTC